MELLENLMQNPYAWTILSLCTIFSLIFSIYAWVVGKQFKELSMSCTTNELIKSGSANIGKLDIQYNGETIKELSASTFYIWNSGNQTINDSDIVSTRPISITNTGKAHIFDVQITRQSEPANAFVIASCTSESVTFDFEYMGKGDGFTVQVLHSGPSVDLELACKMKDGKAIRDCSPTKRKQKGPKLSFAAEVFGAALPTILAMLISSIVLIAFSSIAAMFSPVIRSLLALVLTIFPFALTFYFSCWAINMVKQKCRRAIPVSLKSNK